MHITMAVVVSADGFIAGGDDPRQESWTSQEDKDLLKRLLKEHALQVMGSTTYDIFHPKPSPDVLRVILTAEPEKYAAVAKNGQLEFKNFSPLTFVRQYETRYAACLLLGGAYTYAQFLTAGLVDEIYMTVEPIELKQGVSLFNNCKQVEVYGFTKPEISVLNERGTVLKHYMLKK